MADEAQIAMDMSRNGCGLRQVLLRPWPAGLSKTTNTVSTASVRASPNTSLQHYHYTKPLSIDLIQGQQQNCLFNNWELFFYSPFSFQ
jgi:hypothetical protein